MRLILVTGKNGVITRLPKKPSEYVVSVNCVLPENEFHKESHGIWCKEDGHLRSF